MKNPQLSSNFVVEVLDQSKALREALSRYRTLLDQPNATASECEMFAINILDRIAVDQPTPTLSRAISRRKAKVGKAISLGRQQVLQGKRPKLLDAIARVMGKETLSSPEIFKRLKKKGWQPGSANPVAYISYMLSDNPEVFARPQRGYYQVKAKKRVNFSPRPAYKEHASADGSEGR